MAVVLGFVWNTRTALACGADDGASVEREEGCGEVSKVLRA